MFITTDDRSLAPEDFDAFWEAGLRELAKAPVDAKLERVEKQSTEVADWELVGSSVGLSDNPDPRLVPLLRDYGILSNKPGHAAAAPPVALRAGQL